MNDKINRKDLKSPDEFMSTTKSAVDWLVDHRVLVLSLIGVATVIILGVLGVRWFLEDRTLKSSQAFAESFKVLEARVVERDEAPETSQADGTYPSEADKLKASVAALEAMAKEHSGSEAASLAQFFTAESKRRLGEHDAAVAGFEAYLKAEGLGAVMAPFAVEGLGASYEEQNKLEEAKAQYQRLTEAPFLGHKDRGLFHLARLEQKAGRAEVAARQFQAIVDEFPQTIFLPEIQARLSVLPEVPHVAPAPEPAKPGQGLPEKPPAADKQG
ncbi:MAG TPA: tetratricopeptide repeat protein [Myxococcota bacterium]|nr:tetratricopeptide repeat protein [Myxococcota bacterium]HRY94049.1 tetratricopeptide repeat protein [Myxococcota bacterium]